MNKVKLLKHLDNEINKLKEYANIAIMGHAIIKYRAKEKQLNELKVLIEQGEFDE